MLRGAGMGLGRCGKRIIVAGKDNGVGLPGGGENEGQEETLPGMRTSFDCNEKSGDFTAGYCVKGARSAETGDGAGGCGDGGDGANVR